MELEQIFNNIQNKSPLIHFITNYVTVNDCANICLACNASPIMTDEELDVEDIVKTCSSLLLNIGTLNQRTVKAMLTAGRKANMLEKPIIFDPVGAGATSYRDEVVKLFLRELELSVIKGNISEIKNLFGGFTNTKGVDAAETDLVTEDTLEEALLFAKELSIMTGSIIVITGPIDIISDSKESYICRNGHPFMPKVTGTGCMMGGVIASYIATNPDQQLLATTMAVCAMGICGELAYQKMCDLKLGTGTFRSLIIDFMSNMNIKTLRDYLKMEKR